MEIKGLSLNDLIDRFIDTLDGFLSGIENVIEINKTPRGDDISQLRGHITERLNRGEEVADNKLILQLLDLLSKDQAVLQIVKEDAEEWVAMLEAIEEHMEDKKPNTAAEKKELRKISTLTSELKALVRK
jgi:hypothetical protein